MNLISILVLLFISLFILDVYKRQIVHNDYSIADIATFPWVIWLDMFYQAAEQLELAKYKHVNRWVQQCRNRPLTVKGLDRYGFNEITR